MRVDERCESQRFYLKWRFPYIRYPRYDVAAARKDQKYFKIANFPECLVFFARAAHACVHVCRAVQEHAGVQACRRAGVQARRSASDWLGRI